MRDNEIYTQIIIPFLTAQLALFVSDGGYDMQSPVVAQNYQPVAQGAPSQATVLVHKITDPRYGAPSRKYEWNSDESKMINTESQIINSTFQLSCLFPQTVGNVNQLTATDILQECANILQSDVALTFFKSKEIGVERITNIRTPTFVDDKNRFEFAPSFDFTLTHKRTTIRNVPILTAIESGIYPI